MLRSKALFLVLGVVAGVLIGRWTAPQPRASSRSYRSDSGGARPEPVGLGDDRTPEAEAAEAYDNAAQQFEAAWKGLERPKNWLVLDRRRGHGGHARKVRDPRTGIVFILVEPGEFLMGSKSKDAGSDEKPVHRVRITKPFYLAETETTVGQWTGFVCSSGYKHAPRGASDGHPQAEVSWNDAQVFCKHYGYRLPTEAEWEYACRAGTTGARYGPLDEVAWYDKNSGDALRKVKGRKPNPWGFYDTLGNLWEWCADAYAKDYYQRSPKEDPFQERGGLRVVRGGSWGSNASRAADRGRNDPTNRNDYDGFRVARTP